MVVYDYIANQFKTKTENVTETDKHSSDMNEQRLQILRKVANGELTPEQAHAELLDLSNVSHSTAWTMDKLHKIISSPDMNDGFQVHLKHLWDNNNSKSIFSLTGLDVSHLMVGKKDTSGIQITKPESPFEYYG